MHPVSKQCVYIYIYTYIQYIYIYTTGASQKEGFSQTIDQELAMVRFKKQLHGFQGVECGSTHRNIVNLNRRD